jgi:large subunit ribosomal protein L4
VLVVDDWAFDTPSTKAAVAALAALGIDGKALVVLTRDDVAAALSFRNLPDVQVIEVAELNAYDVLCNDWLVFTRATLPTADAKGDES